MTRARPFKDGSRQLKLDVGSIAKEHDADDVRAGVDPTQ
jgi:hypothetical protein